MGGPVLMPVGRPSNYTIEIANAICDRIAEGEYLTDICARDEFPCYTTVRRWISKHEEFAKNIARAGEDQADYFRWRISKLNDSMNATNWQFVNAQIHNLQWIMGRVKARAYGDKVQQEMTGADGGPIKSEHRIVFVDPPKQEK